MKVPARFLFLPLLAVACGTPAAPSPPPALEIARLGLSLQYVSHGESSLGWGSPTTFTLRVWTEDTIESATLILVNAKGETLAEASVNSASPKDAAVSGNTLVQTLGWAVERGYGSRLDGTLVVRTPSGVLLRTQFSIAHRPPRP